MLLDNLTFLCYDCLGMLFPNLPYFYGNGFRWEKNGHSQARGTATIFPHKKGDAYEANGSRLALSSTCILYITDVRKSRPIPCFLRYAQKGERYNGAKCERCTNRPHSGTCKRAGCFHAVSMRIGWEKATGNGEIFTIKVWNIAYNKTLCKRRKQSPTGKTRRAGFLGAILPWNFFG